MTGQDLVTMAQDLTGRTSEADKMLRRINMIQRWLYGQYDWNFSIKESSFTTYPVNYGNSGADITLTFNALSVPSRIQNSSPALWLQGTGWNSESYQIGGYLYDPTDKKFYKIVSPTGSRAYIEGPVSMTTSQTRAVTWFRIDYSLEQNATDTGVIDTATYSDFGKLRYLWLDNGISIDLLNKVDFEKSYQLVDASVQGKPQKAVQVPVLGHFINPGGDLGVSTHHGVRLWPIPDSDYRVHYSYFSMPADVTLTSTPFPNDRKWHDLLAWGAAWLTRLDDVDTTRHEFKAWFDQRLKDMLWAYQVEPNAPTTAYGPRQFDPVNPGDTGPNPLGW